jgi:hypothetical protein
MDLSTAPWDQTFDTSYRRISVAHLLHEGQNTIDILSTESRPLPFLPAAILWGTFAVNARGQIVAPPETIALGDWRSQGYPALAGTGRYRATVDWATPPSGLAIDSFGYPASVTVNGRPCGRRPWSPFEFDVRGPARAGRNVIVIEVASTIGHLFLPTDAPPIGLGSVWTVA